MDRGQENHYQQKILERREKQRSEIARLVTDSIENKKPLLLPIYRQHGDRLIYWAAYYETALIFAKQHGLDPTGIFFSTYSHNVDNPQSTLSDQIENFERQYYSQPPLAQKMSYYERALRRNCWVLGIPLEERLLKSPPRLLKMDTGPMSKYNEEESLTLGKKLETEKKTQRIVLLQGGSNPEKRFTDEHIEHIANFLYQLDPSYEIVVISDQTKTSLSEKITIRLGIDDLNKIVAYCYSADTVVGTDSFMLWLAAGAKRLKKPELEPADIVGLYTVADPAMWGIPGADIVVSPVLLDWKKKITGIGVLPISFYTAYALADPESRRIVQIAKLPKEQPIVWSDIALLEQRLQHIFKKV